MMKAILAYQRGRRLQRATRTEAEEEEEEEEIPFGTIGTFFLFFSLSLSVEHAPFAGDNVIK